MTTKTRAPFIAVFRPHQRPAWVHTYDSEQEFIDAWLNGDFARSCFAGPSDEYADIENPTFDDAVNDVGHDLHDLTLLMFAGDFQHMLGHTGHNWPASKVREAAERLGWIAPQPEEIEDDEDSE